MILIGYFLIKFNLIDQIRNIKTIGWATLIFGLFLYLSDKFDVDKKISNDFNYKAVFFIGVLQVLSLVPGVSRSGITITAARILKFDRFDSAKISFLISMPTLAAVSLFGLKNMVTSEDLNFSILNLFSILKLPSLILLEPSIFTITFVTVFSLGVFVFGPMEDILFFAYL